MEERATTFTLTGTSLVDFWDVAPNYSGVNVTESTAMGISAIWRAVAVISQAIAGLKIGAVIHHEDGTRERVDSWIDDPCPTLGLTAFEFWEMIVGHLLLYGNAYLINVRDRAGRMVGVIPIHPSHVTIEWDGGTLMKTFHVSTHDGRYAEYTDFDLTHIMAMSSNGLWGRSLLTCARSSFGTTVAGDRAAAGSFANGAMIHGFVTPEADIDPGETDEIARQLRINMTGYENAGRIPVINRQLKFNAMQMTMADAQFVESRQFQIEEISRWTGVPPHLLMQTSKQTSWGQGVAEQGRGLARTVLGPIAERISQRMSRLLPSDRRLEFDFAALERPTPEQEIDLLLKQVAGGLMTVNEARAVRNMPPVPDGDVLYQPAGSVGSADDTDDEPEEPVVEDDEEEMVPA